MLSKKDINIDEETIRNIGLRLSDKAINAQIAPEARVFEIAGLENVYIMESDLYGNVMPKDTCFLAFYGRRGLMGQHLKVDSLKELSVEEIKKIVERNSEG
jgi:hypothetical protein